MSKEIKISIDNLNDITNNYNKNIIKEEFDNYLVGQCTFIKNENIILSISGFYDENNKERLKKTIHNYYNNKLDELRKIDKIDTFKRIVLMTLGIILIIISKMFNQVISEVFLVAGWVAIWETVYNLLFVETKRKLIVI